jgi:hypothetical protein
MVFYFDKRGVKWTPKAYISSERRRNKEIISYSLFRQARSEMDAEGVTSLRLKFFIFFRTRLLLPDSLLPWQCPLASVHLLRALKLTK